MNKKKFVIILCIGITVIILGLLTFIMFMIEKDNLAVKNSDVIYIVIKQIDKDGNKEILYQAEFTDELTLEMVVESKISENGHNTVVISNGKCYVKDQNCPTKSCGKYLIERKTNIFNNNIDITCLPNGLYISLSNSIE